MGQDWRDETPDELFGQAPKPQSSALSRLATNVTRCFNQCWPQGQQMAGWAADHDMDDSLLTEQDRCMLAEQLALEGLHAGAAVDDVEPFDSGYTEFSEESLPSYLRLTQNEERIIRNEAGHSPYAEQKWIDPDEEELQEDRAEPRSRSSSFNQVQVDSNGALRVAPPVDIQSENRPTWNFGGSVSERDQRNQMHEVREW